jgi:hypothetical protein
VGGRVTREQRAVMKEDRVRSEMNEIFLLSAEMMELLDLLGLRDGNIKKYFGNFLGIGIYLL